MSRRLEKRCAILLLSSEGCRCTRRAGEDWALAVGLHGMNDAVDDGTRGADTPVIERTTATTRGRVCVGVGEVRGWRED